MHVTVLTVSTVDLYSGMCNQHVYLQDFSRIHEKYKFLNELIIIILTGIDKILTNITKIRCPCV